MEHVKVVATNRKARFDYQLEEVFEAGMVLTGTEVKSLRAGRVSLTDGYATVRKGEMFLVGVNITPYEFGNRQNHEPTRDRKLLLHKREIRKLIGKVVERGFTLVPTRIYFKDGKAKVEIALARGKRQYDKRETIKRREQDREVRRLAKMRGRKMT